MTVLSSVSVVIVNYNAGELLGNLVDSLLDLPLQQVVVVDNGSTDGSTDCIQQNQLCRIVLNEENRGFAAACNQAVALTDTEFVLILNPDCEISLQALQQLLEVMREHPQAGLCAPLVYNHQGREQSGSRRHLPTSWRIVRAYAGQQAALDLRTETIPEKPMKIPAVSGACMLLRRQSWNDLSGMDAGYFLHFEDLDLMARLQQHDWQIWLQPKAKVKHLGGHSSRRHPLRISWYKHKSLMRYLIRHNAGSLLTWTIIPLLAWAHFAVEGLWLIVSRRSL